MDDRESQVADLMSDWSKDWQDRFGRRPDGSMLWQVNAHDVMLLVWEIEALRSRLDSYRRQYGTDYSIPTAE